MGQMHTVHEGKGIVLFDGCPRCEYISHNLDNLDTTSLTKLADVARELQRGFLTHRDVSDADIIAANGLRLMARIVYASGISHEVAR